MALTYNLERVHNYKECLEDGFAWTLTDAIIWASFAVDIGEITKKNYKEFHTRTSMWEETAGPFILLEQSEYRITEQDVKRYIGITTNVRTRADGFFDKKIGKLIRERAERSTRVNNDDMFEEEEDNHENANALGS